ncbi:hypothetical protein V6N11_056171 [Hibiscus sabdariffa]|uniref:Secreted protein n=1 Tax=Hibiscus sabdariffa TaxID=183260 RepID=A0ABR2T332_9ROSI
MMIWPCLAALMAVAMALAQQLVGARCCCGRRFPSSDALALSLHRIIAGDGAGHLPIAEHRCAQGPHAPGGDRVSADWFCRCIVFSAGDGTGHLPVAKVSPMFSASMCAWASVPSVPLRLQCIAFCRLRCLALAVQPYVLLPVSCWMRWCAIPWALASAPASSYAHALAGAYTAPWHRAHRSILQSAYSGPLVP